MKKQWGLTVLAVGVLLGSFVIDLGSNQAKVAQTVPPTPLSIIKTP
ncbi:hypothetical protein EV586_102221 [Tumebacillus sp. BK434]|nr:hypothetical protein [Tumebacillus sp. BK434]TCP57777.1 hypothetical protein EV586_102221 [Tumebacillus sp. BK434]